LTPLAPLHFGLILPNYGEPLDDKRLASAASAAEEAGFDSGWVTDHVLVPPEHAHVYGTIAEALASLGFLAARTERLELGVSALVVPQRNRLVVLKQLTTLDLLSRGRIVTAVTAEFQLLGADFERRGRLLDEWLDLTASVFEQMPGRVVYEGEFFSVDGWLAPALVRPGGPELWVAGVSRATLRRARHTGVWHPSRSHPTSSAPWPRSCAGAGPTAGSCCASESRSAPSPRLGATSAAVMRSPAPPTGRSSGS
jgi:alkanesulfonate monooxygenase SsuD/methylene tetrahydromethanopterin reductase-like flavin-dependent oxidoreductase (luciferase family)